MIEIKGYTKKELDYIKSNYQHKTIKEICNELSKSYNSVCNAIRKLNLTKQVHNTWTDSEIDFLKQHYVDMTSEEISKHINHTIDSINTQRDRLGLVRHNSWTQEEVDFLMKHYLTMSHDEIGNIIGKTSGAINAKCFDLGLYKKELPWTDEEIEYLRKNYMDMTTSEIASHLHRTKNAVKLRAERMGMKKYPYTCDYDYFDSIDTEEKAYWIGFLIADGWISKNENTNAGAIGVELKYGDIEHLKKFNKSINGNYKITDSWKTCRISTNKNKKNHLCCLRIFSLHMCDSLMSLGFSKDKTTTCCFPNINPDLIRHFMRGYYDGDGTLCLTNKSFHVEFTTASREMHEDIRTLLTNLNLTFSTYEYYSQYSTQTYKISINKNIDKINFLDFIYQDSTIYLDRKYKKYIKAKQKYIEQNDDYLAS